MSSPLEQWELRSQVRFRVILNAFLQQFLLSSLGKTLSVDIRLLSVFAFFLLSSSYSFILSKHGYQRNQIGSQYLFLMENQWPIKNCENSIVGKNSLPIFWWWIWMGKINCSSFIFSPKAAHYITWLLRRPYSFTICFHSFIFIWTNVTPTVSKTY